MRPFVPLLLLSFSALAPAELISYRATGAVADARTRNAFGAPIAPSVVTTEYAAGTPVELTFAYDPAQAPISGPFTGFAVYDAPFAVTGRIGGRRFGANAGYVEVFDGTSPNTADVVLFHVSPASANGTAGLTSEAIVEENPFAGSGYALTSMILRFERTDGTAFSGTGLPPSLNLGTYNLRSFSFSYQRASDFTFVGVSGTIAGLTSVPEPATLAALGLGAVALLRRRGRRG